MDGLAKQVSTKLMRPYMDAWKQWKHGNVNWAMLRCQKGLYCPHVSTACTIELVGGQWRVHDAPWAVYIANATISQRPKYLRVARRLTIEQLPHRGPFLQRTASGCRHIRLGICGALFGTLRCRAGRCREMQGDAGLSAGLRVACPFSRAWQGLIGNETE